jgi:hypothetical protein
MMALTLLRLPEEQIAETPRRGERQLGLKNKRKCLSSVFFGGQSPFPSK